MGADEGGTAELAAAVVPATAEALHAGAGRGLDGTQLDRAELGGSQHERDFTPVGVGVW